MPESVFQSDPFTPPNGARVDAMAASASVHTIAARWQCGRDSLIGNENRVGLG